MPYLQKDKLGEIVTSWIYMIIGNYTGQYLLASVFTDISICMPQYLRGTMDDLSVFDKDRITSVFDSCICDTILFVLKYWFDISGKAAVD